MTNRKSHTRFRLVPKSTIGAKVNDVGSLNDRYALCCRKDASFGAHNKNLNEDRPVFSAAKCRPMTLVSGCVRFTKIQNKPFDLIWFDLCEYSRRIPGEGLSRTLIFSVFVGYFSDTLEMRPALLNDHIMQSVVGFSVILKCITLNGLDWLFRVKFCFRASFR